ncbi:MAG: hypothetical protein LC792_00895 [Actinobacteria bacterium]|nr:hypothetical protein [Actinomycetota bacterium]
MTVAVAVVAAFGLGFALARMGEALRTLRCQHDGIGWDGVYPLAPRTPTTTEPVVGCWTIDGWAVGRHVRPSSPPAGGWGPYLLDREGDPDPDEAA